MFVSGSVCAGNSAGSIAFVYRNSKLLPRMIAHSTSQGVSSEVQKSNSAMLLVATACLLLVVSWRVWMNVCICYNLPARDDVPNLISWNYLLVTLTHAQITTHTNKGNFHISFQNHALQKCLSNNGRDSSGEQISSFYYPRNFSPKQALRKDRSIFDAKIDPATGVRVDLNPPKN